MAVCGVNLLMLPLSSNMWLSILLRFDIGFTADDVAVASFSIDLKLY